VLDEVIEWPDVEGVVAFYVIRPSRCSHALVLCRWLRQARVRCTSPGSGFVTVLARRHAGQLAAASGLAQLPASGSSRLFPKLLRVGHSGTGVGNAEAPQLLGVAEGLRAFQLSPAAGRSPVPGNWVGSASSKHNLSTGGMHLFGLDVGVSG
jgi:hypothetical protein